MQAALAQLQVISEEDHAKVKALANIARPLRSVIFKTPDDYGMTGWTDLVIPSDDVTPLEAWYIPAKGGESNKLIIFNHALPMCRAGFPGHLGEPWSLYDGVEIDFVIQYKHLTDAGYNVLTYDIRNHGNSAAANGGLSGIGQWEWRDCVGVKAFVDSHPSLSKMQVDLYSQCMEAFQGWLQPFRAASGEGACVSRQAHAVGSVASASTWLPRCPAASGTSRHSAARLCLCSQFEAGRAQVLP